MAKETVTITDNRTGKQYEVPIQNGTIRAMDLRKIKVSDDDFGLVSYDPAFMNTASCRSKITFIDGDKGILRYRGYPIEQLAEKSNYLEVAYLILNGELPTKSQLADWTWHITHHTFIHENIKKFVDGFHHDAHTMGMLVGTIGALSTFYPDAKSIHDAESRQKQIYRLIGKVPTIAAFVYRHSMGMPYAYPDNDLSYTGNFLNMMFKMSEVKYQPNPAWSARWTCCSSCMRITSRTAAPTPCAALAARRPIRSPLSQAPPQRSMGRCTAAPMKKCCAC